MTLADRIARQVAQLPVELKGLLDDELAAGNTVIEAEKGSGDAEGHVYLVLERPFHRSATSPSVGVVYRETEGTDRHIAEFAAFDQPFSLVHVTFRPMALRTLAGPPVPRAYPVPVPETVVKAVKEEDLEPETSATADAPSPGNAAQRFIDSMTMTFDMWHDGTGYDLDALRTIPEEEIASIESLLIARQPRDWRDIEALEVLDTPGARKAIQEAVTDPDPKVRRRAAATVGPPVDSKREAIHVQALNSAVFFGGLSEALDEAEEFHPPKVIEALLDGALNRHSEVAVNFAAMLFFLHGNSKEAFDWDYRPFFLRFHTPNTEERLAAFRELCEAIGVDPGKYQCTLPPATS